MFMIPTRCTSRMRPVLALILLLLLAPGLAAHAQERSQSRPQKRVDWPRTFGGQPDFEFEREETLNERAKESVNQGVPPPDAPTLESLLEDASLDPLALDGAPSLTTVTDVTATSVTATESLGGSTLPSFTTPELSDLTEFKTSLTQALQNHMQNWQPDLTRYSLDYLLRDLQLQTVVTSPLRYAVINGQRYQVGDRFQLPLSVAPSDVELIDILQSQMPAPGTLPPETMARYRDAVDAAIRKLADDRQKRPQQYQQTVTAPATVLDIQSRKVILSLNGQRYELPIRPIR